MIFYFEAVKTVRAAGELFFTFLNLLFSPSCSVQDYFVRLANQKKGMLASSHLVLQSPEGTKYQAAKKWGLPAVTMHWILESARTGQKAEEGRFLVDLPPSPGQKSVSECKCLFYLAGCRNRWIINIVNDKLLFLFLFSYINLSEKSF